MSSTAEMYAFYLQHEEPNNYSRIPNIISHLTYDYIDPETGEKSIQKLTPYARELYRVMKQTAGDDNRCWKTIRHLAEESGMSVGMVSNARKELEQSFHQLGGESLIKTVQKQKASQNDGNILNKTTYNESMIVNIWGHNNAFFKMRKEMKKIEEARSQCEHATEARSQCEHATEEARSHSDTKQDNGIKIPLYKKQQPMADAIFVAPSKSKKRLFPSEEKQKAYEWLINGKCREETAYSIVTNYSIDDIRNASLYQEERIKSGKTKCDEPWAYFQNVLQKRYWEKKCK